MSSRAEHLDQAKRNRSFSEELLLQARAAGPHQQELIDWTVVVAFYTALHLVEALLALNNVHPKTHTERTRELDVAAPNGDVRRTYRYLRAYSEEARYGMRHFELDRVDREILNLYLPRIERAVIGGPLLS